MLPPNAVVTPYKSTWVENLGDLAFHEDKAKQLDAAATFMSYFVPETVVRGEAEKAATVFNKVGILLLPRSIGDNESPRTLGWVEHIYQVDAENPNPFWGHFFSIFGYWAIGNSWVQPVFTTPQFAKKISQAVSTAFSKRVREVNAILKSVGCENTRKALVGIVMPPHLAIDASRARLSEHVDNVTVRCHLSTEPTDIFYEVDSLSDARYTNSIEIGYHRDNLSTIVARMVLDLLFKDLKAIVPTNPQIFSITWPIKDCVLRIATAIERSSVADILGRKRNGSYCYEMHCVVDHLPPWTSSIHIDTGVYYNTPSCYDPDFVTFPDYQQILEDGFINCHKQVGIGVQLSPPQYNAPAENQWHNSLKLIEEAVACYPDQQPS